ncbi:MAG: hypothetical protein Q8N54_09820 [Sulfurimicrobium sp.]|jgi:hypothetical protein|nr:hypothetical protein [Sulfurimicrobium sp.]MDO9188804.1 hypothetical protein [Sulfurimicrobium sp.]MDP2963042.1 hypothetical protein [Sulfurimicrobium sp.]MDP3687780.1 hypothetical protein [Sulfurimicrobium sp.]
MTPNGLVLEECDLAEKPLPLFDEHGRCIPSKPTAAVHSNTRRYFAIVQPEIEYGDIYKRIKKHLGVSGDITASEFERRAEVILQKLQNDPRTKKITDGVRIPFILPKATYADYGDALERIYLKAVRDSFNNKFPQYDFVNHHKDGLAGKLSIAPESRHARLVEAMQKDQAVGYFFPCLTEYSVPAAIEQAEALPDQFLLAGGFDTCAAMIATPDLLLRTDGYPPLLWLGALQGEKEQVGYHFEAYGYNLTFNRKPHFNQVAEYWCAGLVVLG